MTRLMRDALLVIQELTASDRQSPTLGVVAAELCLAHRSGAHRIVGCLIERGYLARSEFQPHGLVVLRAIPMPDEPEIELTLAGADFARARP